MFACLNITPRPSGGILSGLAGVFSRPRTELSSARAFGAEFLLVDAEINRRGEPDWERIAVLISPYTSCLIVPEGYAPPPDIGFTPPCFPEFEQELLLLVAGNLIDATKMPIYKRMLGIYDPEGLVSGRLTALLRHFSSVRVVTGSLCRYSEAASRAMEELGAPVIMGDTPSDFADCALLICPDEVSEPLPLLPSCPVLAGSVFADARGCNVFSSPRLVRPPDTVEVPAQIDFHDFAGALFNFHGIKTAGLKPSRILINGKLSTLKEAGDIILREAGYPSGY